MALPLGDFSNPLAVQAIEPSITAATPGEVLGATAGAAFDSLPTVSLLRQQQRFNESGPDTDLKPAADPRTFGSDVDAMAAERGDAPTRVTLQPEEANAKAKAAGAQVTFDKPIADTTVQSVIDDHLTQQQRADVIARNGSAILSGVVPRFVTGSLISLADPINLGAMMIPAAPEAFVAEKLAAAASAFERTAIRGAAGAVNGAVGMAALEPFNYAMSKADYNDWSAGEALRRIFTGAALGAGGHMLMGGLFGDRAPRGASTVDAMPEIAPEVPEPAPNTVRLYHGGSEYAGGSRWLTPDQIYAEGYAKKSGGFVHYVDLPADHPELVANTDYNAVAGTNMKPPVMHFDASPEVAAQLRPLNPGAPRLSPTQANTAMEALRAGIGQAAEDRPVDVADLAKAGELNVRATEMERGATRSPPPIEADTFRGSMDLIHGNNPENGPLTQFRSSGEGLARYEDGEGVFGPNGIYMAENGKWVAGENGALGLLDPYKVAADFKNALVLTPDTEAGIIKRFGTDDPREIADRSKEAGHDGIIVRGYDKAMDDERHTKLDLQDQVFATDPTAHKVVRPMADAEVPGISPASIANRARAREMQGFPAAPTPDALRAPGPEIEGAINPGDLWRKSPEDLQALLDEAKLSDKAKLAKALGEDGAKEFTRLDRARNSSDPARADAAEKEFEAKFGTLTPEQERLVYGVGEAEAPQVEDIQRVLDAHMNRADDAHDAGYEAALAMRHVAPADIMQVPQGGGTAAAQAAYVQLMHAHEDMANAGVAPEQIANTIADALVNRGGWKPGDAAATVGDFIQQLRSGRAEAPRTAAQLRIEAQGAAKDMANRAMNPPADPVVAQAARINKATIDAAPKITGDMDKDLAEATKMVQDMHQQLQTEIASGRIMETQEMRDAMTEADHTENVGKASAGYAACLAGKSLI